MDTTPEPPTLARRAISVREFCDCYAVSRSKAYELFGDGTIRTVKLGARTLVPVAEAEKWFRSLEPHSPKLSTPQPRTRRSGRAAIYGGRND